jgi:hypothetical protein
VVHGHNNLVHGALDDDSVRAAAQQAVQSQGFRTPDQASGGS